MKDRHLFLFGGSPPFGHEQGRHFAELVSLRGGKVVILFIKRDGWQEYMPKYTQVLQQNGVRDYIYFALTSNPPNESIELLKTASGIIICGGDTSRYQEYIAHTEVGEVLVSLYKEGIPIAGFSAGVLICPTTCVISPNDNEQQIILYKKGLGILSDTIIGVHFSQWNDEDTLTIALKETSASVGYGIDEGVGVYFYNEKLSTTEGGKVHTFVK